MKFSPLLLVEDDAVFAQVLSKALAARGLAVTHAPTRQAALDIARRQAFAAAVLDLKLASDTTLSLVPELKTLNPDMRIVMLTGYASIQTAVEATKLGATQYLPKPASVDEILAALSSVAGNPAIPVAAQPLSVDRLEWEHIQRVLAEHDGNISATARALNMHRRTLQRKLAKKPVKQ
jgi:two-component system, response regulator RegA